MVETTSRTVRRTVDVEVHTTKDGREFFDWSEASRHETSLENAEALDALLARPPASVKAAVLAAFTDDPHGLWVVLDAVGKHLPEAPVSRGP